MKPFTCIILAFAMLLGHFVSASTESTTPLSRAQQLLQEKSYSLAARQFEQALSGSLSEEQRREALYGRAVCAFYLGEQEQARNLLEKLINENVADRWHGLALWRLAAVLAQNGISESEATTITAQLKEADLIIREKAPEEYGGYLRSVINDIFPRWWPQNAAQKDFQIDFYRKAIAATKELADVAELHRRLADFKYSHQLASESQYLRDLRNIVAEFPQTVAARQAQVTVAQHFVQKNDLKAAFAEWKQVTHLWPGTPEAREAERAIADIVREFLDLELDASYAPGKPIRVELVGRNVSECRIEFFRVDPTQLVIDLSESAQLARLVRDKKAVLARKIQFPRREDYRPTTSSLVIDTSTPDVKLVPGVYLIRCSSKEAQAYRLTVIGNLALLATSSGTTAHFWVVSADSGKPRTGARITVCANARLGKRPQRGIKVGGSNELITELITDENGFAQCEFERNVDSLRFAAVAQDGDEWAIVAPQYAAFWREQAQTKCYAYTDRPAYRPGDSVGWRAIIRDVTKGQYAVPADSHWKITIFDARGSKMGQDECKLSEFGSIAGTWTLPKNASLGLWRIEITNDRDRHVGQATFRVEEYKKPEFEVSLEIPQKLVRWGATVPVRLQAKYLFGAPVAGASVHYTITAQPQWWFPTPLSAFTKYDWFEEQRLTDPPSYHYYRESRRVAEGDTITDTEGTCKFSFLAAIPNVGEQELDRRFYNFTVTVTVTDSSRRAVNGTKTIPVGTRALRINLTPSQRVSAPGDLLKVAISAQNLAGEPVAAHGEIAIEKLVWDPVAEKDVPTTLAKEKLSIRSEPETIYEWRIPQDFSGRLRVLYVAEDPFGGTTENWCIVDVGDPTTKDLGIRYQGITVHTDKDIYEIGDKARILILNEYPDCSAWLWVDSGSGIIDKQVIPLRYRSTFLELPITEQFVPNVSLRIVAIRDHQLYHAQSDFSVPPSRQILTTEIISDKESYRPRQEGTLLLRVQSWDGKPVRGEFSLSVYDKAIEYIQKSTRQDIRKFFYSSKRAIPFSLENSLVAAGRYHETVPPAGPYDYEQLAIWRAKERGAVGSRDIMFSVRGAAVVPSAAPQALKAAADNLAVRPELAEGGESPDLIVRTDFRDSILWIPNVVTDANGTARVTITFPDSLTTWRIEAVGIDEKQRVGESSTTTLVQKSLSVRLALPRFLVEHDIATISAIARNDSAETKSVTLRLGGSGDILWDDEAGEQLTTSFALAPKSEKRIDRIIRTRQACSAVFRAAVWSRDDSDACETTLPVIIHGLDKSVYRVGSTTDISTGSRHVVRSSGRVVITDEIVVPAERVKESSLLRLQISPSLAVQLRQALPYLVDYPYGCVEQTMSRFLPAAIVAKTYQDLGIPRDELLEKKLPEVIRSGIERLRDFQRSDGSWGWWKNSPADDYMTAHVMFGLSLAREADYSIPAEVFDRGLRHLERTAASAAEGEHPSLQKLDYFGQRDLHALAYQCLVLTLNKRPCERALDLLWQHRDRLAPVGLAMLGRALWLADQKARAETVQRNLMNFAVPVDENETLYWQSREGQRWYWWWNDRVEATCFAMMALLDISPDSPALDRAAKWLVLNRRGAQWRSTKDTGLAVMSLAQYLKKRKSDAADARVTVTLGDMPPCEFHVTKENFFTFSPEIVLEGKRVPTGKIPVKIEVVGDATITYSLAASYFSLEEPITSASHELVVERRYDRLKGSKKQPDGRIVDEWVELREGDELRSGDRIRVTLQVRAFNDYEYLVFEDPKPAGCESAEVQSGWSCDGVCGYREYRDQQVTSFISHLPQGTHVIQYELRAEVPGRFHTLPARGYAMYCPEVCGNSDEVIVTVLDKK